MAVTKCVCFNRTFAELLPLCRTQGWTTVGAISSATGCGTGCGGCRRYLHAMLLTGHTSFRVQMGPGIPEPQAPEPWELEG
jgi:NAD(P)H-nitrite reductase large subunit